jgi:putative pyruvate formate lyase activating enzyme
MPGGSEETRQISRFLAREISPETFINIMPQFRPAGQATQHPAIYRPLRRAEFEEAMAIARQEGLRRLARE